MRGGSLALAALVGLAGCGGNNSGRSSIDTGRKVAAENGCTSCHSTDGSSLVGPTWKGLFGSRVELSDGTMAVADEAYLRESMLQPSAKTVKGFREGLMETVIEPNSLTDDQVRALIAFIESLR